MFLPCWHASRLYGNNPSFVVITRHSLLKPVFQSRLIGDISAARFLAVAMVIPPGLSAQEARLSAASQANFARPAVGRSADDGHLLFRLSFICHYPKAHDARFLP